MDPILSQFYILVYGPYHLVYFERANTVLSFHIWLDVTNEVISFSYHNIYERHTSFMCGKCPAHLITPDLISLKVSGAQYNEVPHYVMFSIPVLLSLLSDNSYKMRQLAIHNVIITIITLMFRDKSISLLIP